MTSNSLPEPDRNSLDREARIASAYTKFLEATILASLEQFDTLTVAAAILAISEIRRQVLDRRTEIGAALWRNTLPPRPDAPDVTPVRKHRKGGKS